MLTGTAFSSSDIYCNNTFTPEVQLIHDISYKIIAPIIVIIGIIGNVLNLIVLSSNNLKGVTYTYLKSLAVVDLANMLFAIPTVIGFMYNNYPLDYGTAFFFAHFEIYMANCIMAVSVYLVLAVTIDRYISVAFPTKFMAYHTNRQVKRVLISAFLVAFAINLPYCWFYIVDSCPNIANFYHFKVNTAVVGGGWWVCYLGIQQTVVRVAPALVIVVLNCSLVRIFRYVVGRKKKIICSAACVVQVGSTLDSSSTADLPTAAETLEKARRSSIKNALASEETRLVCVLMVFNVIILAAITPAALLNFLKTSDDQQSSFETFRAFANNMEYLSCSLNFYLYCTSCKIIRQNFKRVFCSKFKKFQNNEN